MNFKKFPVINAGTKKLKIKVNKEKYPITYLSKKEYSQKIDEAKNNNERIEMLGYTTLKDNAIKNDCEYDDNVLGLLVKDSCSLSTVERSKKKFRSVKGYLYTGYNRYVAIEKFNPLIIFLFVFLGLLCAFVALGYFAKGDNPIKPWIPVFEEVVDSEETKDNDVPDIVAPGFTTWYVPAGKTQKISTYLTNPDGNPCYFEYKIYLEDSGELLYKSNMVKPGTTLKKINLNKALSAGNYDAVILVSSYEPNTGKPMDNYKFNIDLIVR